ncbi:hypothetical protein ACFYUD_34315 [Nocardia tengchongensis]|uniref:phage shock envelope stress response protein PspM n=1 Tax=Nocardia tengchongensis TaxID=2055889 RepID=UPI00368FCDD9
MAAASEVPHTANPPAPTGWRARKRLTGRGGDAGGSKPVAPRPDQDETITATGQSGDRPPAIAATRAHSVSGPETGAPQSVFVADPARDRAAFSAAPGFAGAWEGSSDSESRDQASGRGRRAKKRARRERATEAVREVLEPTGFEPEELAQRLPDTLRGVGEQALVAVRKWADPRERELRKRRRARRRSFRLGTASGLTTAGTVGLVLISAPAWAVVVVGGGAVALVTGTAVTARRYLDMRREPLPQATFVPRKLPPIRSAARASIARLVRAERALHGLHTQIARSGRLPADDLDDTLETAASGAAALHALAQDVVAMERASGALGVNSPLGEHVRAVSVRLDGGVIEYEGMVAAAARVLAVPESAAVADDLGWAMVGLRDAADRLDGWAQALIELADQRFRTHP